MKKYLYRLGCGLLGTCAAYLLIHTLIAEENGTNSSYDFIMGIGFGLAFGAGLPEWLSIAIGTTVFLAILALGCFVGIKLVNLLWPNAGQAPSLQKALLITLPLFACATHIFEDQQPRVAPSLAGTTWILSNFIEKDTWIKPSTLWIAADLGHPVTITFSEETVRGQTGCNDFAAKYGQDGADLVVEEVELTDAVNCSDALAEQSEKILQHLRTAQSIEIIEDTMFLMNGRFRGIVFDRYSPCRSEIGPQ